MSVVLITGSNGLVGSESVNFFSDKGFKVVGVDNDLRKYFFGKDASTKWQNKILIKRNKKFKNYTADVRSCKVLIKFLENIKKILN